MRKVENEEKSYPPDIAGFITFLIINGIIAAFNKVSSIFRETEPEEHACVYTLIVEYLAVTSDGETSRVSLETSVKKEVYDRHPPGTQMKLRFAKTDHRLVLFDWEVVSLW